MLNVNNKFNSRLFAIGNRFLFAFLFANFLKRKADSCTNRFRKLVYIKARAINRFIERVWLHWLDIFSLKMKSLPIIILALALFLPTIRSASIFDFDVSISIRIGIIVLITISEVFICTIGHFHLFNLRTN